MDVMQFVGVGSDGQLWSTARAGNGNWLGTFDQPPGGAGVPGFRDVDTAGVGNGVCQVVAIGKDLKTQTELGNQA
jgi:hypothetical protein